MRQRLALLVLCSAALLTACSGGTSIPNLTAQSAPTSSGPHTMAISGCTPTISYSAVTWSGGYYNAGNILSLSDVSTFTTSTSIKMTAYFKLGSTTQYVTTNNIVQAYSTTGTLLDTTYPTVGGYPGTSSATTIYIPYGPCKLSRVTVAETQNIPGYWIGTYYQAPSTLKQSAVMYYP